MKERIKAVDYIECSALTSEGIQNIFQVAIRAALDDESSDKTVANRECPCVAL